MWENVMLSVLDMALRLEPEGTLDTTDSMACFRENRTEVPRGEVVSPHK